MRSGDDERRAPKYAHIERERRWLIDPVARPMLDDAPSVLIEDRYISATRLRLRRMTDQASGEIVCKLTKKYVADDPRARPIVTAYLSAEEYAVLTRLPASPLTKRRHQHAIAGIVYSVDRFEGPLMGLELAEIEWGDDAGLHSLPAPPGAIRDVSDDVRYEGGMLAQCGLPKEL